MRNDRTNPDPSPEQLAAFLDGELDAASRACVEAWLTSRPDAAAEIDGQRRLLRLWRDNPPREPRPAAWDATLAAVRARLPGRPARPRRLPRSLWLGAGLAAAVLIAVLLARFFLPAAPPRVDKHDAPVVVIPDHSTPAPAPAREPILLVSQKDVSVIYVEPYWKDDGQAPQIGEGDVPMITAPLVARAGGREP